MCGNSREPLRLINGRWYFHNQVWGSGCFFLFNVPDPLTTMTHILFGGVGPQHFTCSGYESGYEVAGKDPLHK